MVIAVSEQGLVGASSGDSGAWMVGADASIDDLTAGQHPKLRLGSGKARPVSFSRPKLQGTLLVATDGLFNYARPQRIAELVLGDDLDLAVKELVQLVRLPAGGLQDDVGAVLLRQVDWTRVEEDEELFHVHQTCISESALNTLHAERRPRLSA